MKKRRFTQAVLLLVAALLLLASCDNKSLKNSWWGGGGSATAELSADPTSGVAPLKVTLKYKGTGDGFCTLDYGDGSTPLYDDCEGEITHTYKKAGTYTAKFSVNAFFGDNAEKTVKITVKKDSGGDSNHSPTAELSADTTKGKAPLKVTFTLKSSDPDGDNVSCSLDFGDGSDASSKCSGKVEHTYEKSGDYTAKFVVKDSHDAKAEDSVKITVEKGSGGGDDGGDSDNSKPIYVYAAGDIAEDDKDNKHDDETAQIIIDKTKNLKEKWYVLAAGDLAYREGKYDEFIDYYDPSWGKFKKNTYPVPGNHEYKTSGAAGFFKYWEEVSKGRTNPTDGWYSLDLGNGWRFYAINNYKSHDSSSKQYKWLAKELKDHPSDCIIAMSHDPRYSPGPHGDNSHMDDIWDLLVENGGDVFISGHDHLYARFKPIDEKGNTGSGMVQFVVGTGGIHLYKNNGHSKAETIDNSVYGVLELKLLKGSYAFKFHTTEGKVLDKGDRKCNASKKK